MKYANYLVIGMIYSSTLLNGSTREPLSMDKINFMIVRKESELMKGLLQHDPTLLVRSYMSLAKSGTYQFAQELFQHTKPPKIPLIKQKDIAKRLILTGNYNLLNLFTHAEIVTEKSIDKEVVDYAYERLTPRSGGARVYDHIKNLYDVHIKILKKKRFEDEAQQEKDDSSKIKRTKRDFCSVCYDNETSIKKIKTICSNNHGLHRKCLSQLLESGLGDCPVCKETLKLSERENAKLEAGNEKRRREQVEEEERAIFEQLSPEELLFNTNPRIYAPAPWGYVSDGTISDDGTTSDRDDDLDFLF